MANINTVVYEDDDYKIVRKGGEVVGTMEAPYALLDIAISSFERDDHPQILDDEKGFLKVQANRLLALV